MYKELQFPVRLEFGQPVTIEFEITKEQVDLFAGINETKDAYIEVISVTTVGEVFYSNKFSISKLIEIHNTISMI